AEATVAAEAKRGGDAKRANPAPTISTAKPAAAAAPSAGGASREPQRPAGAELKKDAGGRTDTTAELAAAAIERELTNTGFISAESSSGVTTVNPRPSASTNGPASGPPGAAPPSSSSLGKASPSFTPAPAPAA